ncbi:MAG: hypothetical protein AAFQ98_03885 [Bacteroidota bacterium]
MSYRKLVTVSYVDATAHPPKKWSDVKLTEEEKNPDRDGVNLSVVDSHKNLELRAQLIHLGRVADFALSMVNVEDAMGRPEVLKIFLAPEFLFIPTAVKSPAKYASYSREDRDVIRKFLEEMFNTKAFKHWILVPGTTVWYHKLPKPVTIEIDTSEKTEKTFKYTYLNTAYMVNGGEKTSTAMTKRFASRVDGIGHSLPQDLLSKEEQSKIYETFSDYVLKKGGRSLATEICLDHGSKAVLKHSVIKAVESKENSVDFHLVCAAGMDLNPGNVVAKKGGYVFRVDGNPTKPKGAGDKHTPTDPRELRGKIFTELHRVQEQGWEEDFSLDEMVERVYQELKKLSEERRLTPEETKKKKAARTTSDWIKEFGRPTKLSGELSMSRLSLSEDLHGRNGGETPNTFLAISAIQSLT